MAKYEQAYAKAIKAGDPTFTWKGRNYNTKLAPQGVDVAKLNYSGNALVNKPRKTPTSGVAAQVTPGKWITNER